MNVAFDEQQMIQYIREASRISKESPVVISKFVTGAREVEVDGVSDGRNVFIGAVIEHVENAGVHSGDATMSIPTITIKEGSRERIMDYARRIARDHLIISYLIIMIHVKKCSVRVITPNA